MIDSGTFQKEWFDELRKKFQFRNSSVAEKMIHALALVEELAKTNLDFVLKGGTSLILLLSPIRRFSVDVDIITEAGRDEIERTLQYICGREHFTKVELDEKRSYTPGIPQAHYKLFYKSKISDREDRLLLDILFAESLYSKIMPKQIKSEWLITNDPVIEVTVPSIESILGDKLTAFAPNTTGIQYGRRKELEIAKQLYDIGYLFDVLEKIDDFSASFDSTVLKEIEYRNLKINRDDVLNDIIETARIIATRGAKLNSQDSGHYREIIDGIRSLNEFLIGERFRLENAIIASSKAAYLAANLLRNNKSELFKFSTEVNIEDYIITHKNFNFMNKLRKIPGGSLFYWYHTVRLIENK